MESAVALIDEGNTIPFIARYRKEATGSLDDQVLRTLNERLEYLRNLDKRREEITSSIGEQEKLTPELQSALDQAKTLAELEGPTDPNGRPGLPSPGKEGWLPFPD